jgi:general secretion pathway protein A
VEIRNLYTEFFGLNEKPFSITPDPRYLYLSRRHADALAHLIYGISESGGFIQLTGEVGTGKTTLIRSLLEQLPDKAEIALILNPQLSSKEFLENICEELGVTVPETDSVRTVIGKLNSHLLKAHAEGRRIVLIVDEAQTLSPELLEQVRLLTNLETPTQKLLQIILIGQPELRDLLKRSEMRQIAQRITGRYHLEPLSKAETATYVRHRLRVAGCQTAVFTRSAMAELYRRSGGIPRLINVVADRALLAAYTQERTRVDGALVRRAAAEVFGRRLASMVWPWSLAAAGVAAVIVGSVDLWREAHERPPAVAAAVPLAATPAATRPVAEPPADLPRTVEPAPAAPPPLRELLDDPDFTTDTDSAFGGLFGLWGASYDFVRGDPCAQAEEQRLRCMYQPRGSISQLRTLNLPAILTLTGPDGNAHDLVLKALGYSDAVFTVDGRNVIVSLSDLTHYWFGDHLMLWRPALVGGRSLAPGTSGEDVLWLRETLARVRGESIGGDLSPVYDPPLEAKVRQYQREKMLTVDGIVGSMTQLALTTDLGAPGAPTLHKDY